MDRFLAYMATLCNVTKCNIPKNKLIWQVKYKKKWPRYVREIQIK